MASYSSVEKCFEIVEPIDKLAISISKSIGSSFQLSYSMNNLEPAINLLFCRSNLFINIQRTPRTLQTQFITSYGSSNMKYVFSSNVDSIHFYSLVEVESVLRDLTVVGRLVHPTHSPPLYIFNVLYKVGKVQVGGEVLCSKEGVQFNQVVKYENIVLNIKERTLKGLFRVNELLGVLIEVGRNTQSMALVLKGVNSKLVTRIDSLLTLLISGERKVAHNFILGFSIMSTLLDRKSIECGFMTSLEV